MSAAPMITGDMSTLDAALALARAGLQVFPVDHPELPRCAGIGHNAATCTDRGKHPCVKFTERATTDPKTITSWFVGAARNIGISCGLSGLVVVDEDKLGEFQRFAEGRGVQIPSTMIVATAKGRHYYFAARPDVLLGNAEGALKGYSINIRGRNGYVVGPGSVHETGVIYTIAEAKPPASLPDWLIEAIKARPAAVSVDRPRGLTALPEVIRGPRRESPGERDEVLFRYACSLRARETPRDEAEALFRLAWERCEQPPVCTTRYTWQEALGKLANAYNYPEGRSPEYRRRDMTRGEASHNPPKIADDILGGSIDGAAVGRTVQLTRASSIKVRPVHWLWADRVALGTLALLGGREGVGKSTVAYLLAADVTRGRLPGHYGGKSKAVIVAATEDSWAHTIVPRLMAAGADLDLVYRVDVMSFAGVETGLSLPRDLVKLEESARQVDAALILLDPLMSRLDAKLDTHKDAEVRLALEPLVRLADVTAAAVVGLIHVNKSHSTDPLTTLMASRAFAAVARAVLFVMLDPDDERIRLLGQPKNNLGRTDLATLTFRIESAHVADTDEGPVWSGRVHWTGERDQSIRDALEASSETADARSATGEAAGWLLDHLTAKGGTDESANIKREGAKAGHSQDALKRARRRIKATIQASGFPRTTYWTLPNSDGQSEQHSRSSSGESALTAPTALNGLTGKAVGAVGAVGGTLQEICTDKPGREPEDLLGERFGIRASDWTTEPAEAFA
jgi:hypothetical protein